MNNYQFKLESIDQIQIGFDKNKLDKKLKMLSDIIDDINLSKVNYSKVQIEEVLKRVYRVAIEIGNSKAFESANFEISIIEKGVDLARSSNVDKDILKAILKLYLSYTDSTSKKYDNLKMEIEAIN